jgi:chemotaxis protein MotB
MTSCETVTLYTHVNIYSGRYRAQFVTLSKISNMRPIAPAHILLIMLLPLLLFSCVTARKHKDLTTKYNELRIHDSLCALNATTLVRERDSMMVRVDMTKREMMRLHADSIEVATILDRTKRLYNDLSDTYERLQRNTNEENKRMLASMKDLEAKLKQKEKELDVKEETLVKKDQTNSELSSNLKKLQEDLKIREAKVKELEQILNAKDSAVKQLKNSIAAALLGFKDQGMTVQLRNGKVYVSLDEQLLFASGSIVVDKKGKEALLQLSKALAKQPDVAITVEGHTDDQPMSSGQIKDNFDLSVLRATSIVRILTTEGKIDPKKVTASGRGEHFPVAEGKTAEARKKNRRTEIIITPKLDELFQILGN